MKLAYAWQYSIFSGGLNKFFGLEREAYWRGGLIERGAKKRIHSIIK